jgi:sigma54-dependent transcription regulator
MVTVNIEDDEIVDLFYAMCKTEPSILADFLEYHVEAVKAYARNKLDMIDIDEMSNYAPEPPEPDESRD